MYYISSATMLEPETIKAQPQNRVFAQFLRLYYTTNGYWGVIRSKYEDPITGKLYFIQHYSFNGYKANRMSANKRQQLLDQISAQLHPIKTGLILIQVTKDVNKDIPVLELLNTQTRKSIYIDPEPEIIE